MPGQLRPEEPRGTAPCAPRPARRGAECPRCGTRRSCPVIPRAQEPRLLLQEGLGELLAALEPMLGLPLELSTATLAATRAPGPGVEGPSPGGTAVSQGQAGLPREGGPDRDWPPRRHQMGQEARPTASQGAFSWGAPGKPLHPGACAAQPTGSQIRHHYCEAGPHQWGGCSLWGKPGPPTTALLSA